LYIIWKDSSTSMDDIFDDLMGKPKPVAQPEPSQTHSENGVKEKQAAGNSKSEEPLTPQLPHNPEDAVGLSKEALHSLVTVAVEGAMDNLLGKFVKSLRTVRGRARIYC